MKTEVIHSGSKELPGVVNEIRLLRCDCGCRRFKVLMDESPSSPVVLRIYCPNCKRVVQSHYAHSA